MFNYIHKNKIKSELEKARLDEAKRLKIQYNKKIDDIIKDMNEQADITKDGYEAKYNILLREIDKLNEDIKSSQNAYKNYRSEVARAYIQADELEDLAKNISDYAGKIYQAIIRSQNIMNNIIRIFKSKDKKNSEKLKVIEYKE